MSCCGGNRAIQRTSYRASIDSVRGPESAPARTIGSVPLRHVTFEYNGPAAITVTGPATGVTYRFSGKGVRLPVHGSDAPSLVSIPGLRAVR
jgi:hypothetical protein